jgi:catechol 2,3-dioxygenase-like lactoylglutathione lyase family enzyme
MRKPSIDQQVTFLYTRDLAKTSHFYENLMKLPLILDQGSCRIYQVSPDGFLGFCERETAPVQPQGIIFTLVTAQVDEWYTYLTTQGISFEKKPTLNPVYNIYHTFLRDPNGYLLEIQQFRDPAWPTPGVIGTEFVDHPG